jgi:hypothetical protein
MAYHSPIDRPRAGEAGAGTAGETREKIAGDFCGSRGGAGAAGASARDLEPAMLWLLATRRALRTNSLRL